MFDFLSTFVFPFANASASSPNSSAVSLIADCNAAKSFFSSAIVFNLALAPSNILLKEFNVAISIGVRTFILLIASIDFSTILFCFSSFLERSFTMFLNFLPPYPGAIRLPYTTNPSPSSIAGSFLSTSTSASECSISPPLPYVTPIPVFPCPSLSSCDCPLNIIVSPVLGR